MEPSTAAVSFARRVFFWAGVYGIVVLVPQYFLERAVGERFPPPITHPEAYYAFIGVALAWQFAFLLIARDVVRYRLIMLPGVAEKVLVSVAIFALYAQGRVTAAAVVPAVIDLVLAVLFVVAYKRLQPRAT